MFKIVLFYSLPYSGILWRVKWWPGKFLTGENMAEFLEIRHIFPVMIHNYLTSPVLLWLVKLLTGKNMAEFPETLQFNPVIIFPSKVVESGWVIEKCRRVSPLQIQYRPKSWLQKMLMCSDPDLEILQCAAEIWGSGGDAPSRVQGRSPCWGVRGVKPPDPGVWWRSPWWGARGRSPPKFFWFFKDSICNFSNKKFE